MGRPQDGRVSDRTGPFDPVTNVMWICVFSLLYHRIASYSRHLC